MPGGANLKVYDDLFKYEVIRTYVDLKHSVNQAAQKHGVPVPTLNTWLAKGWAKAYVRDYELKIRDVKSQSAIQTIEEAKIESLVLDYNYNINSNTILSMIEDRAIEIIPKCKSLRELSAMYKVVSDVKLKLLGIKESPDGKQMSDKATMILNIIDKQLTVTPEMIKKYFPMRYKE
jgi:transposase-like protein